MRALIERGLVPVSVISIVSLRIDREADSRAIGFRTSSAPEAENDLGADVSVGAALAVDTVSVVDAANGVVSVKAAVDSAGMALRRTKVRWPKTAGIFYYSAHMKLSFIVLAGTAFAP